MLEINRSKSKIETKIDEMTESFKIIRTRMNLLRTDKNWSEDGMNVINILIKNMESCPSYYNRA